MRLTIASLCFATMIGISACGGDNPGAPSSPAATILKVNNELLIPIAVYVNGDSVGRVEASTVSSPVEPRENQPR